MVKTCTRRFGFVFLVFFVVNFKSQFSGMKNLFKLIIGPYLILWAVQILAALFLMLCFDHISGSKTILNYLMPIAFVLANYWLCDKLVGLFSEKQEQFDARYPGKFWKVEFFRYIWPLIAIIVPYFLLLPVYSSGLYWHIQEKYFLWPEFQNSASYLTKNHLLFITKLFYRFCSLTSVFMFISVYNYKLKNSLTEKIIFWLLILFCYIISIESINSINELDYKNVIVIIITILVFLWFALFKPKKSTQPFKKSNFNFYFFTALIVFQIAFLFNFNGLVFPLNYFIILGLIIYCYCKVGLLGAIIGAICGLNFWSALWLFFCIPDSILCKCKNCGKRTFSFKLVCPGCNKSLEYEANSLILRIKTRIRPGAFLVATIFIIIIVTGFFIKKKKPTTFKLTAKTAYGYDNIIIYYSDKIIGTNFANISLQMSQKNIENNLSFEFDGEKLVNDLSGFYYPYRQYGVSVLVTTSNSNSKTDYIFKKATLYDYDINKIDKIGKLNNDTEALLLINAATKQSYFNKSLYNICEKIFSNYWFSLTEKQQRKRFDFYLNNPQRINNYVQLISKYANPKWFKFSPVIPDYNPKIQEKVYSEEEVENFLFSRNVNKLRFYKFSMCSSPLIQKICLLIDIRDIFLFNKRNNIKPTLETLNYLRKRTLKIVQNTSAETDNEKRVFNRKVEDYIKTLVNNPELITQKDIEIIKKGLEIDENVVNRGAVMALDIPEIWTAIGQTKKEYSGRYRSQNLLPRELKSSNAFEVCEKLLNICFAKKPELMAIDIYSRIPEERAINKVLEILPKQLNYIARNDAINRAEILRKYAEQTTNYNRAAEIILKYPFPDAEKTLKSIQDNCSEENKIKIDSFCKTILLQND